VTAAKRRGQTAPDLPESVIAPALDNTWHDTAEAVIDNWIGKVYQTTSMERKKPFAEGIDPRDPLRLRA
jgi:homoserine O-succinyltransferase